MIRFLTLLLLLGVASSSARSQDERPRPTRPPADSAIGWHASGNKGAVVAGGAESVEAGLAILQQGGNPIDAALTTLVASTSVADPVYPVWGQSIGQSDYNDSHNNLVVGGNYTSSTSIAWEITQNNDLTFTYKYTFTGFTQPGISHVILTLTRDAVFPRDLDAVTGTTYNNSTNGVKLEFNEFGPGNTGGNPGFPNTNSIIGVKFDETPGGDPMVIEFTSNRAPVWGDIYVKGGSTSYAYNTGLTNHLSTNVLDFIARPNGVIPEPSTLALCGTAIFAGLGMGLRRIRRRV